MRTRLISSGIALVAFLWVVTSCSATNPTPPPVEAFPSLPQEIRVVGQASWCESLESSPYLPFCWTQFVVRQPGLTAEQLMAKLGTIYGAAGHAMGTPRRPDELEEGYGGVGSFSISRYDPGGSKVTVAPGDQNGAVLLSLSKTAN
jgi:hypothetical protein